MNTIRNITKGYLNAHKRADIPSEGKVLLHGQLIIKVIEARNLPDMDGWVAKLLDKNDVTDGFVDVRIGRAIVVKTAVIDNDLNPKWDEVHNIDVCHLANEISFEVKDKDHACAEFIGSVDIQASKVKTENLVEGWFPIMGRTSKSRGELKLSIKYTDASRLAKSYDIMSYFQVHENCNVTLYQDAEVPLGLPIFANLQKPDGRLHVPARCFYDIYHGIKSARNIICVTGWAVWDKLTLQRGRNPSVSFTTIGDLLIERANAGVDVYVMIWSEKTSSEAIAQGFLGTHDMETYGRFKGTKVKCALAPRALDKKELSDYFQNEFISGTYTHHQKSIVCDAHNPNTPGKQRLIAFVGGFDLTGGRWDTPSHPLFSTLLYEHKNDFRNKNVHCISPTQGPREPWHDIHARVEGSIAFDVFQNFSDRWLKQGQEYGKIKELDLAKVDVNAQGLFSNGDKSKLWNVQLFRSITSDSCSFDLSKVEALNGKKGRMVDSSLAKAYIQLIRNAENFIYIENQYFIGSAHAWRQGDDANCYNTIPIEIAQKIVSKIQRNQRFTAYILIPMFPEGNPACEVFQEILYWQTRTIEMMYRQVADALATAKIIAHPTDYLLFLCLGKREAFGDHLNELDPPSEPIAKLLRYSTKGMHNVPYILYLLTLHFMCFI